MEGQPHLGVLCLFNCNREADCLLHRQQWPQVAIGLSPEVTLLARMETAGPSCGLSVLRLFVTVPQQVAVMLAAELMEESGKVPW